MPAKKAKSDKDVFAAQAIAGEVRGDVQGISAGAASKQLHHRCRGQRDGKRERRRFVVKLLAYFVIAALAFAAAPPLAAAQGHDADELAQKLSNPISNLVSVPIQANFDFGAGADNDGFAFTANVQPVIPVSLDNNWNMISRTILPIAYRDYLPAPGDDTFGLGDITQSLFFSPKQSGVEGLTWGVGPAFLVPTATDDVLGAGKWGAGPTAIVLQQTGPWTVGALVNHIWSVAGDDDRDDVSSTFLQPFAAYALGGGRTISLNTESSYDWEHEQWTVPVNLSYSQVFTIGEQHMSWALGGKYYLDGPEGAPQWGLRATLTFVFPQRS